MTVTNIIVGFTVLISYLAMSNFNLKEKLMHIPYLEKRGKEYYRFLSSGFIHADWMHLGINMFVLYQFGNLVEQWFVAGFGQMMGSIYFLVMYLGAIVFADLPSYLKHQDSSHYRALGASGGVSGVFFASAVFQPWSMIYLYGIIGIPTIIAGVAYLIYSSYAAKQNRDNIGHDAHFYGAVFGFFFTILISPAFLQHFMVQIQNIPFLK